MGTVSDILITFQVLLYDRWVWLGVLKTFKKPDFSCNAGTKINRII